MHSNRPLLPHGVLSMPDVTKVPTPAPSEPLKKPTDTDRSSMRPDVSNDDDDAAHMESIRRSIR
jgi:hypothetical protein